MDPKRDWRRVTVDGEAFEWCLEEGVTAEIHFAQPAKSTTRKQLLLLVRLAGVDLSTYPIPWKDAAPLGDEGAAGAIRAYRDKIKVDPAVEASRHATKLRASWMKLPLFERMELSRTWLERWERRCAQAPNIEDPSDLHAISAGAQLAARAVDPSQYEEEAAAQERDVVAALERMPRVDD
jgi:hypothetical protein